MTKKHIKMLGMDGQQIHFDMFVICEKKLVKMLYQQHKDDV